MLGTETRRFIENQIGLINEPARPAWNQDCAMKTRADSGRRLKRRRSFVIHQFSQFLSGFEKRNSFCGNIDLVSRFGVAPNSCVSFPDAKTPKSTQFNFFTFAERLCNALKYRIYNNFSLFLGQVYLICHLFNKFCFRHQQVPPPPTYKIYIDGRTGLNFTRKYSTKANKVKHFDAVARRLFFRRENFKRAEKKDGETHLSMSCNFPVQGGPFPRLELRVSGANSSKPSIIAGSKGTGEPERHVKKGFAPGSF